MLWYKSWLDTRWRFLIGLAVVLAAACGIVVTYPQVQEILNRVVSGDGGSNGRALAQAIEAQGTYRGYVWVQWFDQNLGGLVTIFAASFGSGSPLSGSGRGLLLSLSLPVTRPRWVGARAGTGLAELLVLAFGGSIAITLLSPFIGERFSLGDAVVHGACMAAVGAVFFGIASLLSTAFNDVWRPLLLSCAAAVAWAMVENAVFDGDGLFALMSADDYFRNGSVPWIGLLVSVALTAALLLAAAANVARRDY